MSQYAKRFWDDVRSVDSEPLIYDPATYEKPNYLWLHVALSKREVVAVLNNALRDRWIHMPIKSVRIASESCCRIHNVNEGDLLVTLAGQRPDVPRDNEYRDMPLTYAALLESFRMVVDNYPAALLYRHERWLMDRRTANAIVQRALFGGVRYDCESDHYKRTLVSRPTVGSNA